MSEETADLEAFNFESCADEPARLPGESVFWRGFRVGVMAGWFGLFAIASMGALASHVVARHRARRAEAQAHGVHTVGTVAAAVAVVSSNGGWAIVTNNSVAIPNAAPAPPDVPLEFAASLILANLMAGGHTNMHVGRCEVVTGEFDGTTRCFVYRHPDGVIGVLVDRDGNSPAQPWSLTNMPGTGKRLRL